MVCTKILYNYIELALVKIKNIDLPIKGKKLNENQEKAEK